MARKKFSELSDYGKWYRKARGKLIKQFGSRCESCQSKSSLEFCHKIPNGVSGSGRGSYARLNDVKENPDNYKLFCARCHYTFDHLVMSVGNHNRGWKRA